MTEHDHERCSELLSSFVSGDLPPDAAREVEGHLAGCELCRAEQVAVEALVRSPATPLSTDERRTLHAALDQALSEEGAEVVALDGRRRPGSRRGVVARLAPGVGAAALIGLIAIGVASLGGGGDSGAGGGGGADRGVAQQGFDAEAGQATEARGEAELAGAKAEPHWIGSLGPVTRGELGRIGESEERLRALAGAPVQKVQTAAGVLTDKLVTRAPQALQDSIRLCVKEVAKLGYTTLPAFGAEAEFGGRDVLVLGFVWTPEQGPLDRFMVWAFARESCDTVWYRAGPVTKERP
jgi:hypothetical protein